MIIIIFLIFLSLLVFEIIIIVLFDLCVDYLNCDIFMEEFDVCNDIEVVMIVCWKLCYMCDVIIMVFLCIDIY